SRAVVERPSLDARKRGLPRDDLSLMRRAGCSTKAFGDGSRLSGGSKGWRFKAESAHGILTTTLTTKGAYVGAKYGRWRTDYGTGLLGMDTGGHDSVELE